MAALFVFGGDLMEFEYNKLPSEDFDTYFLRLFQNKNQYGLTSQQIADLLNAVNGESLNESTYRKKYKVFAHALNYYQKHVGDSYLATQVLELKKERIRLSDERAALNRLIREQARQESIRDIVRNTIKEYPVIYKKPEYIKSDYSNGTLVVVLSDWHIGISTDTYNKEVAHDRLFKYANDVLSFCEKYNPENCVVALVGDMVSGIIHTSIRIENNENLINQIKIASEYASEFIYFISTLFKNVDVYSVSGNHSRAIPNKDEVTLGEMLDDLIPVYIDARLCDCENVKVHIQDKNTGYQEFYIGKNHTVLVHGDFDKLDDASIGKLQRMTDGMVDVVLCGHLHENSFSDKKGCHVIQGGCLCGSNDGYCVKNRLSCISSQIMAYFDKDDVLKSIIPVYF